LGLDIAANSFYKSGEYTIRDRSSVLSDDQLLDYYKDLVDNYRLAILEDAFQEDAWDSWKKLYNELSGTAIIVGDDLLVTNPKRVQKAISEKACNCAVIKPNQIGTVSEVYTAVRLAHEAGWKTIVSHRSGDTLDTFIADLAVGLGCYGIKAGSPGPLERRVKYERLIAIEELEFPNYNKTL